MSLSYDDIPLVDLRYGLLSDPDFNITDKCVKYFQRRKKDKLVDIIKSRNMVSKSINLSKKTRPDLINVINKFNKTNCKSKINKLKRDDLIKLYKSVGETDNKK